MKQIIILSFLLFRCYLGLSQEITNSTHPKGHEVSSILKSLVENGCPGVSFALLDNDGWWVQSEGLSNIEEQLKMKDSFLHYLQSVAKTYMAVAILKLYENGKLQLDDPITQYLAPKVSKMVDRADEITIKMLLNHTSGIPEYNFDPEYASTLLQYPETVFTAVDYIKFIDGKKLGQQLKYADQKGFSLALVLGTDEASAGTVQVKTLSTGQQVVCNQDVLIATVRSALGQPRPSAYQASATSSRGTE